MYRKNTASQYIYFALVNAESGAALTGATVTAYRALDGGSQASATGTTTELANGQYRFNLSQADTNADYGSFLFTATSAIPVEKTVVFTGANVTSVAFGANTTTPPTASANATAVRSELTTELGRIDATVSSRLPTANYATPLDAAATRAAIGLASANLDTQLADLPTVAEFEARTLLASAYFDASADQVIVGTNNDKTGYSLASGSITATVIATGAIDADAIAADAVTEIQAGLATSSGVTAAFTEIKGAGWSSATDTLEKIRDASGSTSIMVTPVVAQVPVRVKDSDIETYIGDLSTIRVGIFSGEDAVDLSTFGDLEVCVQAKDGTDLDFVEMADLTIDGDDNNYVSWDPSGPSVATLRRGKWSLRKSSNKQVIAKGAWIVSDAALEDTGS